MTLYTAVGKYILKKDSSGAPVPVVIVNESEHVLDLWEMIVWSSLIWNIYTLDELKAEFYRKEREAYILSDITCEGYLERLESRKLIVSGHGITGIDALHDLISKLYIVPVTGNIITKSVAFIHLTFIRHIPFCITKNIFKHDELSADQRKILKLAQQSMLSVGEMVKCIDNGITDVSTNQKLMNALYDDDITTCDNIGVLWRACDSCNSVLEAVSTLYLNKLIIFEVLS